MLWLGMDQRGFKRAEIGSHRKFSSKSRNGATIQTFQAEMNSVFEWLRTVVHPGGHVCFVVGNSVIRGTVHDNSEVLREAAKRAGFAQVAQVERRLKDTAKAFNPKIGRIKTERILVFANRHPFYT